MFETEEEAAVAYDAAVSELFGPYTPTNFDTEYGAHPLLLSRACVQPDGTVQHVLQHLPCTQGGRP